MLTEQDRALLAEIASITERLCGELESVRAEIAEVRKSLSLKSDAPSDMQLPA